MKTFLKLVLVMVVMVLPVAWAGVKPLKNPEPVPIPPGLTQQQVVEAIKKGMSRRNWRIEKEEADKILSVIYVRSHVVKVNITWNDNDVRINYFDSYNMKYEMRKPRSRIPSDDEYDYGSTRNDEKEVKPIPYIHDRYNSWAKNLANDIRIQLGFAASSPAI